MRSRRERPDRTLGSRSTARGGSLGHLLPGLLVAVACGSDPVDPGTNTCGTAGMPAGQECTGLGGCGQGASNLVQVTFCEHCFARADSHLCEAGVCREVPKLDQLGTLRVGFSISGITGAKSMTQASMVPLMADGTKLSCAALLSSCGWVNNPGINAALSNFKDLPTEGDSVISLISADPGADRLYFVALTTERQGKGTVVARGCAEGLSVAAGQTTEVPVTLAPP